MSGSKFADGFVKWARHEPAIGAVVLIGSQVRAADAPEAADDHSDWDFQIVTRRPELFSDSGWTRAAGLPEPVAYALRRGRLGRGGKVSAVFPEAELDLVLIPAFQLGLAKWLCLLGLLRSKRVLGALGDLALVLRPGYRVLKGEAAWGKFIKHVATVIPPTRLDDAAVLEIAAGFVCDCISTRQKIARGELLAAQRWLHHQLAEANFRLLHELKQREGAKTFPDARRVERVIDDRWRRAVTVAALPERESLTAAVELSAHTCRDLMRALVGAKWSWPKNLPLRLRAE